MASIAGVNPYDYKIFMGFLFEELYREPDFLIDSAWDALAQAPTEGGYLALPATWSPWSVNKHPESMQGDLPDEDGVARWTGIGFLIVSNYRMPDNVSGAVSLMCRALKHPWKRRSLLGLEFANYPGPPAWRSQISEAIVIETVAYLSTNLHAIFAPNKAGFLFSQTQGSWVHDALADAWHRLYARQALE
jgi:hypothetical protein